VSGQQQDLAERSFTLNTWLASIVATVPNVYDVRKGAREQDNGTTYENLRGEGKIVGYYRVRRELCGGR
jgi:hypothetical protein